MARTIPIQPVPAHAASGLEFKVSPPLALYIHLPWCVQKCPYCDFNSHARAGGAPEAAYVAALIADLQAALPLIWGRPIHTIFFGGGTPSLFSAAAIDDILTAVRTLTRLQPDAEITLEANPGTVEAEKFAGFRAAGVNRLSLGIQSFNDRHLHTLGRIHDASEARRASELAAQHFPTFNLDLMYGLPGQTFAEALDDVAQALAFAPPHLSCYQLTLEPNTPFAAFPPAVPDSDSCADMQDAIEARLADAGYSNYETSAFAQPGRHCQHNLNYWQFGDYLGIGAGAHSKLTLHDRVLRQMRYKHPTAYLEHAATGRAVQEERAVAPGELAGEFMMNTLRLHAGFPPDLFSLRTSLPLQGLLPALKEAERDGLLELSADAIRPSLRGRRFLNLLIERFL